MEFMNSNISYIRNFEYFDDRVEIYDTKGNILIVFPLLHSDEKRLEFITWAMLAMDSCVFDMVYYGDFIPRYFLNVEDFFVDVCCCMDDGLCSTVNEAIDDVEKSYIEWGCDVAGFREYAFLNWSGGNKTSGSGGLGEGNASPQ